MELLRKAIHKHHGISVYEIKELGADGFEYKYQILNDNGIPVTEKYSSLDYVMGIYQCHIKSDVARLTSDIKKTTKRLTKQ